MVNGSKQSASLNYKENPSLRVIAVGGLALSRGLTLEGLMVSYFYRNTATFDVLMQWVDGLDIDVDMKTFSRYGQAIPVLYGMQKSRERLQN